MIPQIQTQYLQTKSSEIINNYIQYFNFITINHRLVENNNTYDIIYSFFDGLDNNTLSFKHKYIISF